MQMSTRSNTDTLSTVDPVSLRLERIVQTRTGGRVRDLRINFMDDQVVVTGSVPTFYTKQLVTHAVLEEVKDRRLSNTVEVE